MLRLTSRRRAHAHAGLLSLMAPLWGLIAVLAVISNTLSPGVQAAQSTYLNFQARLLTNTGAVVADGYYHVEFKLYNVSSGGAAQWTETWSSVDNSNRIRVVNGYLTANLGADTAFPGTIAWDEQLWLTMNIGGTAGTASWDGEMNPRILLTALPYAFKSAETLTVKKVSGANTGTLSFNTVANNPAILLPDASGTVCLQGSTSCSFAPTTGGSGYIQNGTTVQTANYNIQSAAAGSIAALISGASGQTADILQIKANGVADPLFRVGSAGAVIFKNSTDSTVAFQIQNAAGNPYLLVNTSGATLSLGNTGIASTIQIGNTTGAVAQTINIGTNTTASSSTSINIGSTLGAVNLNGNTAVVSGRTLSVQGGLTSLTANGAVSGDALHVSNSTGGGNIAVFNDDGTAVARIIDDGATILSPLNTYTGSALTITQAGNPTSGNALIKANNTNATPAGNLLDLQTGGSSRFSVDTGGNLTLGQTGNANSTIRKSMNVSGTVAINDVVVLHSTAGTVTRTTTSSDTKVFGVATGSGTPQDIVISGVYQVNLDSTTANVAIGDFLVTSTEAGAVTKSTNPATGSMLGRALSTTGVAGAGQKVWVYVAPGTGGSSDSLQTAYNNSTSPEIVLNTTNNGISIQNASGGVTGNLFEVQSNGGGTTYLGVSTSGATLTGTLSQTAGNLLAGASGHTQALTNASTSGGVVNGYAQTITVNNTTSATTTKGISTSLTDNTAGSLANITIGFQANLSGSNTARIEIGFDGLVTRGIGVRGTSSPTADAGAGSTCGPLTSVNVGVCGIGAVPSSNGSAIGILGTSAGRSTSINANSAGVAVGGFQTSTGTVGEFYKAITGQSLQTAAAAYTSIGIHGKATGGSGATTYGGYFTLDGSSAALGAALYASNSTTSANIFQLQDNTTDVLTVTDGGLVTIAPLSAQTGSALTITQAGNPTSGNALIKANNTNGTPIGNLLDLQTNNTSRLSVDTSGTITTSGQLNFSGTGNVAGTIRKNMIVTSAVNVNDIVIYDFSNAGQVTTTTTANSTRVFGVASATNIAGVAQDIVTSGVFQIRINGDSVANNEVNVGDYITTSTIAGRGMVNNSATSGTAIGRALSRDDASNLVWIFVSPGSGGAPTDLQAAYNISPVTELVLDTTRNGLTIQNGASPVSGNLFEVQSNGGATTYLGVSTSGISVAGVASATTSVQTPLLTTASGAITIETGSAAAINIGSAGSPTANAINLNVNTTVASTKTLTVAGGLTSLNATGNGDALHVSNGTGAGNIAVFNDDGSAVFVIADGGKATLSPVSTMTDSALTITQSGNPTAGNALIKANNTNGTPSGNLLSLQTNGTSQFSVDTSGNVSTNGQLSFAGTGNIAGTIRKNMIVSAAVSANDVVIINVAAAGRVTTTATADSTQVFGIATTTNAGTNIAQDIVTGGVYQVNISPANGVASNDVAVGDFITTSATAGRGKVNNSAPAGTVIGRALSTDDASDKVWIYVTPGAGGSPTSLQQAYNLSTDPEITVDGTRGALTIQDAASPIGANLFEVQSNGGATKYFGVTSSGIAVTGTATVSTSLQTPLVTTGSGNLSLQPATGIVTLNRASTANELRVYENSAAPTNYISIKNGSVTTSSGALTLDTGSAAVIHIGTSGSPTASAINLNVDTTVASTKTLTVSGGLTSLTANASINGEGLNVSNSTGSGNIAVFKDGTGAGTNVVTIANDGYTTFKNTNNSSTAFQVQNTIGSTAFVIDTTPVNSLLTNSNFEDTNISSWTGKGSGTVARDTSVSPYIGLGSLQVTAGTAAGNGAKYDLALSVASYSLSFSIRQVSGTALSASNFEAGWNNGSTDTACTLSPALTSQAPVSGGWVRYSCTFTGSASGHVYWKLSSAVGTSAVFNIDAVQLEQASTATAYKETGISLNGRIDSPVAIRSRADSTTTFQVQSAIGTNAFVVDTLNRRVGIATNSAPTQALEVGGNILASGTITASDFNFANGTTAQRRYSLSRTLPDTNNLYVEVGSFALTNGAHNLDIGITVSEVNFSVAKQYRLPIRYDATVGAWKDVLPLNDSGPYGSENFVLEVRVSTDTAYLRIRRIAGSVTSAVAHVNIVQLGSANDTFTATSAVGGSGSGNGIFVGTSITQDGLNGRVGIQNAAPAYTLDVTGTINSSSTISAVNSVQAPLLTTASGGLSIRPADGVTSFNAPSVNNEIRVYDSGPTNYTYIRNGIIATNTGVLGIDTGNASAINIGSTNASTINMGANTVVAATKNITVTSGTTSLTANSALNGNALTVSNGTGTGNIAIFSDDSTPVLTVADQGILTVRNLTNSATGFQVQNAVGHASLILDTTNKHLKIYEIPASGSPVDYADIYYNYETKTANYTASSGTVAVGTGAGAITINAGTGAAINMTANAASLWRTTAGTLTLQSGTSADLILNPGSSIVSVNGSSVLKLGSSAGDPGTCTAGAVVYNSTTGRLRGCEGSTWQNLTETLQEAYNISISTSPEIKVDTTRGSFDVQDANTTVSGDLMTVRAANSGGLGTVLFGVDSSGNTRLQNTSGTNLLKANGTSSRVEIGSPTSHTTNPIILVVDNYNNATEPTGTNGAIYYSVAVNKFRCYENSAWKDCINGFNTVTKMADQAATQSSTAIQEDNTLRFSVAANTSYIFEAWIPVDSSDANADLRYTFTTPSGATMQILTTRPSSSGSSTAAYNVCSITTSGNACLDTTVNSTANFIKVEGYLANGINAGTVIFQFAQSTATATSFPVIKAGATLSWHTTN